MEHLAFVNAVLGGFAFAFLGALITIDDSGRMLKATFLFTAVAAGCFLVATLGSTLYANYINAFEEGKVTSEAISQVSYLRRHISQVFLLGVLSLTVSIGLIGWVRSRNLGIATTLIAVFVGLGAAYMIVPFSN